MKVLREILALLAGFGLYIVLQATVQYITDQGEREAQVAQACVSQKVAGKWTVAQCARARK